MNTYEEQEAERKRIIKLLNDFKVYRPCCRMAIGFALLDGRTAIVGWCYECGQDLGKFNKIFHNY